ncbi:putative pentatricopeptide repeat protein [Rosellinia necatrix]|uniref:Putative pentatricopeptide repeat protein n=1 Tax=Rosellinia necatrix TaxID=77044 RepID=A0A1W2TTJ6_ROSNE|nr:putative pentatricopeptide repeat protein [Rosellinia necatrix]
MPTIYSSLYQNFIRQGFAKSFTHGYAQSVVAATHPHVLNTQNRPSFGRRASQRVGRFPTLQLQNAFHAASANALQEHRHERHGSLGNLEAYFEALKTKEDDGGVEKEWTQFQFPKPIEWKPNAESILEGPEPGLRTPGTEAVDSIHLGQTSQDAPVAVDAEVALAHIDAAIEKEIEVRELREALEESTSNSLRASSPAAASVGQSRALTPTIERTSTPASVARSVTPPVDSQAQSYADHLTKLGEDGRYTEIPAVFEAMLVADIKPTAPAYNALLVAAIHIPSEKYEAVSKVLDVYADMKRRNVVPNADTYNILVGLLAARCLEVSRLKQGLDEKRVRFGGMDEPGKFMFASNELEHAILSEDDRLDLALKLFDSSVTTRSANYSSETYHQLISACAQAGRVTEMLSLFEHMEMTGTVPFAATFPSMIAAFGRTGDLASAVECYNEYKDLAIAHDSGKYTLNDRLDAQVYASVIHAYVINGKVDGALRFYEKLVATYGVRLADIYDVAVSGGFVKGLISSGIHQEALQWAQSIEDQTRIDDIADIATAAADAGDRLIAVEAFAKIPSAYERIATPAMALLALCVREGDILGASTYWQILKSPSIEANASLIEPTAMYAVAMIGSGQVAEGLTESELMFHRIRDVEADSSKKLQLDEEVEEGVDFISTYMSVRGITDPRTVPSATGFVSPQPSFPASPHPSTGLSSSLEDNFDPYAHSTDFKGSSIISDELEGAHGRKGPRLNEALSRFRNMRRAGRHPRYITYSKLISAAAREDKMNLCHEILSMARTDVPLLPQYPVVRYGWSSILDAMVGACLTLGDRGLAEQYHMELLTMGAAPSANTFGLYITTLKESTKTFDEASEAVKIFLRAKAEGVEPSSFLYNALIGKLGKARRIDDCLFYFAEMRALGIKPTSVTYGTIVNALCRVSDEKFAEELFDEMEAMPNYKARPAPYNSMMQFFLTTKRDKSKVLAYYERMKAKSIAPTAHTFKLLVDTHATLEPVNMTAAEAVLDMIRSSGQRPEPVHYASLIHARGCVLHDMEGARKIFKSVMSDPSIPANACLFQALFEAMVANHRVADTEPVLAQMKQRRVELTPYIANTLIHGWAGEKNITKAASIYNSVSFEKREPSTYEAMTRAYLAVEERDQAQTIVAEMLSRGYPGAVVNKILELLGGGSHEANATA